MRRLILAALIAALVPVLPNAAVAETGHSSPALDSHFIQIPGVPNFRDAGGYRTADGHFVRRGMLYRAGALGGMTPAGRPAWDKLRVASIVDLRTSDERGRAPEASLATPRLSYWSRDYGFGGRNPTEGLGGSIRTADQVRAMMMQGYRTMPREMAPGYRELFARLIAGRTPVVLNCTAGKDRTGIGVALVLTALGVPYPAVRQEFLLSNAGLDPEQLRKSLSPMFASLDKEALLPLAGVEGGYLDTAFAQIRKDYGSIDGYLRKELGVGPRETRELRRRMLR